MREAIIAAGMTPPERIRIGIFERFAGVGKGRGNKSGWCKLITPTMGIFGDWSSGLSELWTDGKQSQVDTVTARSEMARMMHREKVAKELRQAAAEKEANAICARCKTDIHPYLASKGFPEQTALVDGDDLIVPMRDFRAIGRVLSIQRISPTGEKKFLSGGRAKGSVFEFGLPHNKAKEVYFCEGYATGLSINLALQNLYRRYCVVVCFSAGNLAYVAKECGRGVVLADNDASQAGEIAAKQSGLKWVMPPNVGQDFNDYHQAEGIEAVEKIIRGLN